MTEILMVRKISLDGFQVLDGLHFNRVGVGDVILEVATTSASEQFEIPLILGTYDFTVNWGDGTSGVYTSHTPAPSHTYASSGNYDISIAGQCPRIYFNDSTTRNKIKKIKRLDLDAINCVNMVAMFGRCAGLVSIETPFIGTGVTTA